MERPLTVDSKLHLILLPPNIATVMGVLVCRVERTPTLKPTPPRPLRRLLECTTWVRRPISLWVLPKGSGISRLEATSQQGRTKGETLGFIIPLRLPSRCLPLVPHPFPHLCQSLSWDPQAWVLALSHPSLWGRQSEGDTLCLSTLMVSTLRLHPAPSGLWGWSLQREAS